MSPHRTISWYQICSGSMLVCVRPATFRCNICRMGFESTARALGRLEHGSRGLKHVRTLLVAGRRTWSRFRPRYFRAGDSHPIILPLKEGVLGPRRSYEIATFSTSQGIPDDAARPPGRKTRNF
jgi:hypothetical protein